MTVPSAAFLAGMRRLAAGVTIVATGRPGRRAGLTATAVCSVSVDPPQLLVCVNRSADAHDLIGEAGCFTVNVLAADQIGIAERFAGRTGFEGDAKFEAGGWSTLLTGAPTLDGACASFDCKLEQAIVAGTHTIFVGLVLAVRSEDGQRAMLYHDGAYGLVAPLVDV